MSEWKEDSEKYWEKSGNSFDFNPKKDEKSFKFEGVTQFSVRSNRPQQVQATTPTPSNQQVKNPCGPVNIISEPDIISPALNCTACGNIITDIESLKFEGSNVFTNEHCWRLWIQKMIDSDTFKIRDLVSQSSKRHLLDRVCATCNGRLIIKVILMLKGTMGEFEFGILLYDNIVAYNHYMTFLRETKQSNEKLLRCRSVYEEPMKNLREIMRDNIEVNANNVQQFIQKLTELKDVIKLNANLMPIQWEMIEEYACLLQWQANTNSNFINMSLISTVIETQFSYHGLKDKSTITFLKDKFKMTPNEFFWTCIKSIFLSGKYQEIDKLLKSKDLGSKPTVSYERIVSFLYSLNKEPDEFKMRCLLKISNTEDLIICLMQYKLFDHFKEFCKTNKETSQLKKIDQYLQNSRK